MFSIFLFLVCIVLIIAVLGSVIYFFIGMHEALTQFPKCKLMEKYFILFTVAFAFKFIFFPNIGHTLTNQGLLLLYNGLLIATLYVMFTLVVPEEIKKYILPLAIIMSIVWIFNFMIFIVLCMYPQLITGEADNNLKFSQETQSEELLYLTLL